MCLCGNLGLLKESGQYSTLAGIRKDINVKTNYEDYLNIGIYPIIVKTKEIMKELWIRE